MDFQDTQRPMADVMPKNVDWIHDGAASFNPQANSVTTSKGDEVCIAFASKSGASHIDGFIWFIWLI